MGEDTAPARMTTSEKSSFEKLMEDMRMDMRTMRDELQLLRQENTMLRNELAQERRKTSKRTFGEITVSSSVATAGPEVDVDEDMTDEVGVEPRMDGGDVRPNGLQ